MTWKYAWNQILYFGKTTAQAKNAVFFVLSWVSPTHWAKN